MFCIICVLLNLNLNHLRYDFRLYSSIINVHIIQKLAPTQNLNTVSVRCTINFIDTATVINVYILRNSSKKKKQIINNKYNK